MNEDYIRAIFENVRKVNYYEDGESGAILKTCCIEFESQDAARNALERQSTQRSISGNPISLDVVPEWQNLVTICFSLVTLIQKCLKMI